ncbi:ABC transporter, substrate-binding protein, family 3 [Desulfitobacterium hafniense DP7]|uniref:ABC transporter, substrate-binding protein, family 3 n=3 Tax=root TaxID=1 RepID=G9XPN5_DESHA|nr:ABC transporter, substrate-binding protein, family 3 [Desulfitobacterium hafniense DP7]
MSPKELGIARLLLISAKTNGILRKKNTTKRSGKMKKNYLLLLTAALLISSILLGCSKSQAPANQPSQAGNDATAAQELIVGMELAYPPFEMTDEKGNPTGVSVDFAKDLGAALGRPVKIENMAFSGLIPALQTKKIDMVISSMTITDERKKTVAFSDPYAKAWLALLINEKSSVKEVKDLNAPGRKVAVKNGTTGHIYAQANLPQAEIMVFEKESACILEVSQGKADAFIYDTLSIYRAWKQNEKTTRANLNPFQDKVEEWGVALRQDDKELTAKVNQFIGEYKKNGGFTRLAERYLPQEKKDFAALGVKFFFD